MIVAALLYPALAGARSKKLAAVDLYCDQLKSEFRETVPIVFSGPDPWVEIDDAGAVLRDEAIAYVYAEGSIIRWVVLVLDGSRNNWVQTVNYYFREDGMLAKRERFLESRAANVDFEQISYFENGRVVKNQSHHHALDSGREDKNRLDDPNAPLYLSTDELPFPETPDYRRQLARLPERISPGKCAPRRYVLWDPARRPMDDSPQKD